ncbi:hypothetical protein K8O68_07675 [Salipaludibacillus sp. CUR1]|uniref:hypothetical protein n=1 Tax=Salipaludibacillus sp. CUR1 TaxID=2820003 RepID=UPI001E3C1B06|nr:hypothetical protein [Salipaludibacillus sp. CUR1]MCE7792298.1 hypothetical protein [Salipaludibacillus sp. CUR1]
MKKELLEPVYKALDRINPGLSDSLEVAFELVPYLGKLVSHIKLNRLARRFEEHREQLSRIAKLHSSEIMSAEYINERIFPIVLENLIEEHEDAKIQFILNGFENVFIEEKTMESMVLNYFDTLKDLRYLDIKRLFYLTSLTEEYNFEGEEEKAVTLNVDVKLQNMGLLGVLSKGMKFGGGGTEDEKEITRENVIVYSYGKRFINFIKDRNI